MIFVKFKHITKQYKKILVDLLLFLAKLFILLKRLITAFFIVLVVKPFRFISRIIFHIIIVKGYKYYLSFIKKLGWSGFRNSPFVFLLSQKLVQITIVTIVIAIAFSNLVKKNEAIAMGSAPEKTILASLIEGEFGTDEENELVEEFFDEEASITPTEQSYLDSLSAVRPQLFNDSGAGEEDYLTTNQEGTAIKKQDAAQTKKVKQPRTEIVYYSVEAGDTVSTIADNFDISVNTILWENNLNAYSVLHPGDKLAILPESGIAHMVTKGESLQSLAGLYNIEKEIIADANKLNANSGLIIGQKIIIPGGKKLTYASAEKTSYSGFEVLKELTRPFTKKSVPSANPISGNKMNWPTVGYHLTQYYSWRHHAVDIANKIGTPIYAADSGVIVKAGWGTGYGNNILIDHGGGKQTHYGHLSKFYVSVGDKVAKGQAIGAMGSTGWSTGPHLHFEVIIDNTKYNPLNYIR